MTPMRCEFPGKNELAMFFAEYILGWPWESLFSDKEDGAIRYDYSPYCPEWNTPYRNDLI